jgi:tRNA(Ile)-lysidine synthase
MRVEGAPVGDDEFASLLDADGAGTIALAVSGGADSLALLHLADRWSRRFAPPAGLIVLTVDHRLRPASATEAAMVATIAANRGLPHRTLVWDGDTPATGIEAAAREARYRLLAGAMHEVGARVLVTAHHRDDQAETVLMRLARGSGITGLGGMSPRRWNADLGISVLRPLLSVPKARLVATCRTAGLPPAEDESNADPRYARARLRRIMPLLAEEGIDSASLGRMAALLQRADRALDATMLDFLRQHLTLDRLAVARLRVDALRSVPGEIRVRAIAALVEALGSTERRPASTQLEALDEAILSAAPFRRTLGGAIVRARGNDLVVYREPGRIPVPETAVAELTKLWSSHRGGVWDRRFHVRAEGDPDGLTIGPLGEAGYTALAAALRPRPKAVALTLPAFRRHGRLVAVPPVGFALRGEERLQARTSGMGLLADPGGPIDGAETSPLIHRNGE